MYRIEITEVTRSGTEDTESVAVDRVVLMQEMPSIDLPAILRAVNGLGNRKSRKRKSAPKVEG